MQTFLIAAAVVALAELGDKTQLLAVVLAARYRRPWPILAGIVVATLLNHTLAAAVGAWLGAHIAADTLELVLALSFFAVAIWALVPDKLDDDGAPRAATGHSVFFATLIAFFLVEMGDKTQVATAILAAERGALVAVVAGTTLGMVAANAPVLWLGSRFAARLPLTAIRIVAALLFAALGLWVLLR